MQLTPPISMSWMITDINQLKGTDYIEVLPGKFANKHWNPQSVFFNDEHFIFIEQIIMRHSAHYDHYEMTDIDKATWDKILIDLETLHDKIANKSRLSDFQSEVYSFFPTTDRRFLKLKSQDINHVRKMLIDFIRWTRISIKQHDTIAVLGL